MGPYGVFSVGPPRGATSGKATATRLLDRVPLPGGVSQVTLWKITILRIHQKINELPFSFVPNVWSGLLHRVFFFFVGSKMDHLSIKSTKVLICEVHESGNNVASSTELHNFPKASNQSEIVQFLREWHSDLKYFNMTHISMLTLWSHNPV